MPILSPFDFSSVNWTTLLPPLISGLGIGTIISGCVGFYFGKRIERHFGVMERNDEILKNRYEKLYVPLRNILMDTYIISSGMLPLSFKIRLILKGIWAKDLNYCLDVVRLRRIKETEYELDMNSEFPLQGIRKHIKKYSSFADGKLIKLLEAAVRSEEEESFFHKSTDHSLNPYENRFITKESYKLINHIYCKHKLLGDKLQPR